MANDLNQDVLRHLAKLGAQARLAQIETERKAILAAFPDLANARTARRRGRKEPAQQKARASAASQKRRRPMSAAERKAVSDRMTRYWAARRKEKSAKG